MAHVTGTAALSPAIASLPLHDGAPTAPVPGWLVVVGGVVALWVVVAVGVRAADRLFDALESS